MTLENVILSEISQLQKDETSGVYLHETYRVSKFAEARWFRSPWKLRGEDR
jgi:hypothetical protein